MRVFGHFDEAVLSDIYKQIEVVSLEQGQYLFRVGQLDDAYYIVQQGVHCYDGSKQFGTDTRTDTDTQTHTNTHTPALSGTVELWCRDPTMKTGNRVDKRRGVLLTTLGEGESVSSLLSVLESMSGSSSMYKTIEARAAQDDTSVLLRYPGVER